MVSPALFSGLPGFGLQAAFCRSISAARFGGVLLRDQLGRGHGPEARIAEVALQVGIGQLLRLDLPVQRLGAGGRIVRQRHRLHDVEHLERGHALAVRRQFVDLPAAIVGGDRLHPFGAEFAQIGRRHDAAQAVEGAQNRLGDGAAIVGVGAAGGHQVAAPWPDPDS